MNWEKVIFLHVGWTDRYDGTEAPIGGHAYLKNAVGLEAENFTWLDGWCYGYAPVSRAARMRGKKPIPIAGRTLNITKLGASAWDNEVNDITVIWTARRPHGEPVIIGLYDNATVFRFMPPQDDKTRISIAKARAVDCRQIPTHQRTFSVTHKQKGFPGMAAAWFPGEHRNGPASEFLAAVAEYIPTVRRFDSVFIS